MQKWQLRQKSFLLSTAEGFAEVKSSNSVGLQKINEID